MAVMGYALMGVARMGAARMGYVSGKVFIRYGGAQLGWHRSGALGVLIGSLSINQELDETPDTCDFTVHGGVPSIGDEVIVTLGSMNGYPLFAGYALTTTQGYVGDKPANIQTQVAAVDYTWQLGFVLVTAQYRNQSAGQIVQDLVTRYAGANGFTATAVDPNLTTLDEITFTNEDLPTAITRTMRRAGGYWYCDYRRNVHAFLTETGGGPPTPLTPAHPSLADVTRQVERTQVLSRVYVEGRGSRLLATVASGDTMLPLDAVDMFAVAPDVFVKASFQGAEGGAQHLNFSGVVTGGGGSVVGPGAAPTAAPKVAPGTGSGAVTAGAHGYALTFVTAAGESLPGPVASLTIGGMVANPTTNSSAPYHAGPSFLTIGPTAIAIGDQIQVAYAYSTASTSADASAGLQTTIAWPHPTILTTISGAPLNPGHTQVVLANFPYTTDPMVKWVVTYFWAASKGYWMRSNVFANEPELTGQYVNGYFAYYGSNTGYPPANTTLGVTQVLVSTIATGPSGTTSRKLYRTPANLSTLKLLTTIADNTTTTYTDNLADASLGAAPPATDTSGLKQPEGQVLPGDYGIPISGAAPFSPGGGWAIIGNGEQVIRYTTVGYIVLESGAGMAIYGIPETGPGSITAAIVFNSTITAAPMLTGIPASGPRSIIRPLTAGDEIYLVVQVDDAGNQTGLAADVGGAGIREEWVQDRRLSIAEARARGRATLAMRPLDHETLGYRCRDLRTQVGMFISANLPAPTSIVGDYRILAVTIDNFRPHPTQYPTYTVRASSTRFSFDDWLRRLRTEV